MAQIFFLKEVRPGEARVAATPATVKRIVQAGWKVLVERGAGEKAFISDAEFAAAGARIVENARQGCAESDVVVMINVPTVEQVEQFKPGSSLISFLHPGEHPQVMRALAEKRISAFAMDAVPRITRAQKIDALSSQSNIAGYKAVLLGAAHCPKIFPLLMTAAGTLRPARVLVMGAGVAGLQAVATAKRLGAVVEVSDIRPAVQEQVESLGAVFIKVPGSENMEGAGGYAKEAGPEFLRRQAEVTREHLLRADVVICSALVPGKRAPVLISEEVVKQMRPGCVIVDMAAEQGGNCELTVPGETCVRHNVTIIGTLNLPATVPVHASHSYAVNVLNVLLEQRAPDGEFAWRLEDEVVTSALVVQHERRDSGGQGSSVNE